MWMLVPALPLLAQETRAPAGGARPAPTASKPKASPEARAALQAAKAVAAKVKGLGSDERNATLEAAARAYEQVAADFVAEPAVAAQAMFEAGDLWRRHGSLALAETDLLQAARLDVGRYAQRGLLAAADMQRRQQQLDKALQTYAEAAKVDPGTSRAQEARLWQARLLQTMGKPEAAIAAFEAALEAARRPRQIIEACNWLAKAHITSGDLDAAQQAITHAETAIGAVDTSDQLEAERLRKALESMSARRALQRARDKQAKAGKDAAGLEAHRGR
jgi:tetratricopeptide (TPR) repeat protein